MSERRDILLRSNGWRVRGHVVEPERTYPKECSLFAVNLLIGTRRGGKPNTYNEIKEDNLVYSGSVRTYGKVKPSHVP